MKKNVIILLLITVMTGAAQNTKTIAAIYKQTIEKLGMEGACLYEITFIDDAGTPLILTDVFHGEYNETLLKMFCDNRTLTDTEIEKMNQNGQFDKTVKVSVGKKYKLTYDILQGDFGCWSLEAAELITK